MIEAQITKTNAVSFSELAPNLCRHHFAAITTRPLISSVCTVDRICNRAYIIKKRVSKGQVQQIQARYIFVKVIV
jgi:hypothetical protein